MSAPMTQGSTPPPQAPRPDAAPTPARQPAATGRRGLGQAKQMVLAFASLIALIAIFGTLRPEAFLSTDNFIGILQSTTVIGVLAIASTFIIITSGIDLSVGTSTELGHPRALEVTLAGGMQQLAVAGTAAEGSPRLTRIGAFHVDVNPRQTLLVLTNHDVPGVIGRVGTLLGERRVNIAEYHQARLAQGGDALAAVSVDGAVSEETRRALLELPDVRSASVVHFRDD